MNTTLPTGQAGRLLALGLTFIVLALVWLAVASPLIEWHSERAERLDQQRTLERRMEALTERLPELRQAASAGARAGGTGPAAASLLEGATDAVAAASLQQLVQDMATRAGATLSSAETLPVTQTGSYRRIGLHVSVNAPWSVLIRLLQAIDSAAPRMLVDDFQVHGTHSVVQPPDPPLDAGFTVFAFRSGAASVTTR
jgi:general secretion pathway protein M